jgi:hypothetical protein
MLRSGDADLKPESVQAADESAGLLVWAAAFKMVWTQVAVAGLGFQHAIGRGEHGGGDGAGCLVRAAAVAQAEVLGLEVCPLGAGRRPGALDQDLIISPY